MRAAYRKLCRMSAAELASRSRTAVCGWSDRWTFALGLGRNPAPALARSHRAAEVRFSVPWMSASELERTAAELQRRAPEYVADVCREADAIAAGDIELFGTHYRFAGRVAWSADPRSGRTWPARYSSSLSIYGDTGHGDIKDVWELNRHQFLPTLGKAYALTGEERYARIGLDLMEDWARSNPYLVGVNWTSALEVAVRSLAWCWTAGLFDRSPSFDDARRQNVLRWLYQHGRYVARHLSHHFSPYNHLVGEATALAVLGLCLPWLACADRWAVAGWDLLARTMPSQFHPDGGTTEQAIGYHHFTLGFYLQAVLARRHRNQAIEAEVWALLGKAVEFSMHLTRPDGTVPMLGDADEGKALALAQPGVWNFQPYLCLGAMLSRREDFKQVAGTFAPDAAWLAGADGWHLYDALAAHEPAVRSAALPLSGYCVMRTAWRPDAHWLVFDCGEIAAGVPADGTPSAAHGHADALSIEVSAFGSPLLVDPGFLTYNGAADWHRYFRTTHAHNTLVVDDRCQAVHRGRLTWSHAPTVRLHRWLTSIDFDYAEASVRLSYGPAVRHRRAVFFLKPSYWLVCDEVEGVGDHELDRYFHFAAGPVVTDQDGSGVRTTTSLSSNLRVIPLEREGVHIELCDGGAGPDDGWLAVRYGARVRAPVVRFRTRQALPAVLHTLIVPFITEPPPVRTDLLSSASATAGGARGLAIAVHDERLIVLWTPGGGACDFGGWWTDARLAWCRLNPDGSVRSCGIVAGSRLGTGDEVLVGVGRPVRCATLGLDEGRLVAGLSEPTRLQTSLPGPVAVTEVDMFEGAEA